MSRCSADTTPNRWSWDDMARVSDPHYHTVHTCKNWDAIHEFSVKNTAKTKFDHWHNFKSDLKYPEDPYPGFEVIDHVTRVDLHKLHNYDYSYLDKYRPTDDKTST